MTSPTQNNADYDPLADAIKTPAVSWKNEPVGTVRTFQVLSQSDLAQTRNFSTKELDFWPLKPGQAQPDPKMAVVFKVFDDKEQEERTLWCPRPSSMLTAVATAQQEAGRGVRIGPGGVLTIKLTGEKDTGKGEPQKLYAAKYQPPAAEPEPDPLTQGPTGAAPAASDPWATPVGGNDEPPF